MYEVEFTVQDKKISIYGQTRADVPVIYLNTVHGEGENVWNQCQRMKCPAFTLATVSGLRWDHDMSPWPIPPIAKGDTPCTGGADNYLALLTGEIMPAVEERLEGKVKYSAIAGYSLAGLFAVYTLYRTDVFARIASASGSLWFPKFTEYVQKHEMRRVPEKVYFSLGDREAHTKNPYLSCVEERTRLLYEYYSQQELQTTFVLNPGNHFREANRRMAEGIRWILDDKV
ncbi:MAG: alpha/beta hydrolase [Lachnospiraceae bacterium]|nr:alpha/beta hydrolase [Lachnospiraceae bacterium]